MQLNYSRISLALLLISLSSASGLVNIAPRAHADASATFTLDVGLCIDGGDSLYLQGTSMWIVHGTFELPGWHSGCSSSYAPSPVVQCPPSSTGLATVPCPGIVTVFDSSEAVVSSTNWLPGWFTDQSRSVSYSPVINGCGQHGCEGFTSEAFAISPTVTSFDTSSFQKIIGRNSASVTQFPSQGNAYTTIIALDDVSKDGSAWYEIKISFTAAASRITPLCTDLQVDNFDNLPPVGATVFIDGNIKLDFVKLDCGNVGAFRVDENTIATPTFSLPTGYTRLGVTDIFHQCGSTQEIPLTSGVAASLPTNQYDYCAHVGGSIVNLVGFSLMFELVSITQHAPAVTRPIQATITVTIVRVEAIDAMDSFPDDGDLSAGAEFYPKVTIASQDMLFFGPIKGDSNDVYPGWAFSKVISTSSVHVRIEIWDKDLLFDDQVDVGPATGAKALDLTFDIQNNSFTGDASQGFSQGAGDARRAKLWFDIVIGSGDLDQDGIPDGWEINGLPGLDLPSWGADPERKDIFVEVDWLKGFAPNQNALSDVVKAFDKAPVDGLNGKKGVELHIDTGAMGGGSEIASNTGVIQWPSDFLSTKRASFDSNDGGRRIIFHYALYVSKFTGLSGNCRTGVQIGYVGGGFVVAKTCQGGDSTLESRTFMHELGHDIGLQHGGNDAINGKPNYLSIMNYAFQLLLNYPKGQTAFLDYSRTQLPTLHENSLSEPLGVQDGSLLTIYAGKGGSPVYTRADQPIDWDNDGDGATESSTSADVNHIRLGTVFIDCPDSSSGCNGTPGQSLNGYNDWSGLVYRFRDSSDWTTGFQAGASGDFLEEPTLDMYLQGRVVLANAGLTPSIPAVVDIDPDVLNVRSAGRYVTVFIELSESNISNVNIDSLRINGTVSIAPGAPSSAGDHDSNGIPDLMVKFNRQELKALFAVPGEYALSLTGTVASGEGQLPIRGVDSIQVVFPGDVNHDLRVDIVDATLVAIAYGSETGGPSWNPNADIDHNGRVDIIDLAIVSTNYGAVY